MSVHGLSAQVRVRANSGSWRQRGRITVDFINRMFAMGGVSVPVPDAIDAFLGIGTAPAPVSEARTKTKKKKERIDKPDRKLEKQKPEKPRRSLRKLRER